MQKLCFSAAAPLLLPPCLLLLAFLLPACTEPRKACLDIEATNFDAAADEDCCCEYPELVIDSLLPRFGTQVWKPDSVYEYNSGKWFRLKSIVYYLSDFQIYRNGVALPTADTLSLNAWGTSGDTITETFTDDFVLARRSGTNYPVGAFRTSGDFDAVQFIVGIADAANRIIPAKTPASHPLGIQTEGLWLGRDTGYVALQLVLTRDTLGSTVPDTLNFSRPDFQPVLIKKDGFFQHESGYDFKLKMIADYRELFRDVDLSGNDISIWKSQISANLPNVFTVSQ